MPALSESEMAEFVQQVAGLLRAEYMQRQRLVMVELQKRSALLKRQEALQVEIVKEISEKMKDVGEKRVRCKQVAEKCEQMQGKIKDE